MGSKLTIVLTGFMGSGKSAVGKSLAHKLQIPFHDLDQEIEKGEQTSISEIFKKGSESYFRTLEFTYLKQFLALPPIVLSLGGGTVQHESVFETIEQNAILVYLKVSEKQLIKRLQYDNKRPMLYDEKGRLLESNKLKERIQSLLAQREPYYQRAAVTVTVDPRWSVAETTNEVIRKLKQYAPAAITSDY
ncbi:MAG: shikimate kinase [Balneolales bacterium]